MKRRNRFCKVIAFVMAILLCLCDLSTTGITAYAGNEGEASTETSGNWTEYASTALSGVAGSTVEAGTKDNPYLITSAADLAWLAVNYNTDTAGNASKETYFKLEPEDGTKVLDLSAHYWIPIHRFYGYLDGNGVAITGLKIGNSEAGYGDKANVGLFGRIDNGAVTNLSVDVAIYTNYATNNGAHHIVGGIVGMSNGATIDSCTVTGVIESAASDTAAKKHFRVGGIAGTIQGGAIISNCRNEAVLMANVSEMHTYVGGIVAYMQHSDKNTIVINCSNVAGASGALESNNNAKSVIVGGIVGQTSAGSSFTSINNYVYNCYSAGAVNATGGKDNYAGVFIGQAQYCNFDYLYWMTNSSGENSNIAAVGKESNSNKGTNIIMTASSVTELVMILNTNATSLAETYTNLALQTWKAEDDYPILSGTLVDSDNSGSEGDGDSSEGEGSGSGSEGNDDAGSGEANTENVWIEHAADAFESGNGTETSPYVIKNAEQLALLAKNAYQGENYSGKYFVIADDVTEINLADYEWTPIKTFAGVFDGNKAIIKNLNIGTAESGRDIANAGLFDTLAAGSVVENLTVDASIYTNYTDTGIHLVGVVAAKTNGTVSNCTATGQINAQAQNSVIVGGVIGQAAITSEKVVVTNCGNNATVSGISSQAEARIGGVVGSIDERISGQTKTVSIVNCYNTGNVTAAVTGGSSRPRSGGIAGWVREQNQTGVVWIHNCYNTGSVAVTSCANTSTKGTLGSIIGSLNSAWTGYSNLYTLENLEVASDYATVQNCTKEAMSIDSMKAASFADILNANANTLKAEKGYELLKWVAVTDSTPVFCDDVITGQAVSLQISVNAGRLGTVYVEADEQGGTSYTEIAAGALLEKNSSVKLTFAPTAGCVVSKVIVNGTTVEIQNNTYSFTMTEATDIVVTFEVSQTVDVDAIYVKPDAAANGDGTEQSPFQTLKQAADKVSSVLEVTPTANITVYLMGGTYRLDETLALGENHSSLGRVIFKNYQNETPVITSGHKISAIGFMLDTEKGYYTYQLPDSSKTAEGKYPAFRDLLVNGERAMIARTEDLTFKLSFKNQVLSGSKVTSCDNALYVSSEALADITNENLNGVELVQLIEWKSQLFHIASITGTEVEGEKEITLNAEEWENFYETDNTKVNLVDRGYWLQNHLNFLNEPGEFYYDRSQGIIYYYPYADQPMDASTIIEYATLDTLIDIKNAANITFDGISFYGTTANLITENGLVTHNYCALRRYKNDPGVNVPIAAIHGDMVEGIQIQNCVFEELGGSAMVLDYGIKNLEVTGNVMKDIAMAGILVGNPQREWNQDGVLGASEEAIFYEFGCANGKQYETS